MADKDSWYKEVQTECDHKFVYLETTKHTENSVYQIGWTRIDRYYCEKCLEYRNKVMEEWSRDKPEWY